MPRIAFDIESCKQCPSIRLTNQWSSDGWDRMEDWECKDTPSEDPEKNKIGRKIAGCMEWNDKDPGIPEWCPRLLTNNIKKDDEIS